VMAGDTVKRTELRVGVDGGDWFEVVEGLKAGDEIVTAGTDTLADGAAVRPVRGTDPFTGKPTPSSAAGK
jgi:multidrug efflux pump subunit AcrA (membrane-fusion protein)